MKTRRAILLLGLVLLVAVFSAFAFTLISAGANPRINTDDIRVEALPGAKLSVNGYFDLRFRFRVKVADQEYLAKNYSDFSVEGIALKYDGSEPTKESALPATFDAPSETVEDGVNYYVYEISVNGIGAENYDTPYTARLFLNFRSGSTVYTIASDFNHLVNVVNVFDTVVGAYADRADEESAEYPYLTEDGNYSPFADLSALRSCLSTKVDLTFRNRTITDNMKSPRYTPIYAYTYDDGVLTISIPGAKIPDGLIRHLYLNGEERCFELYEGKISFVMEP